ncbi:MAG: energy-coupling factor ABC transporter permease [Oscillospiraceae bacterium]|jgi:cobalt/nickel transport system permease protein|nr:energy-coupling factor ABC transporter permease [Oscillospiraceae bacterium]
MHMADALISPAVGGVLYAASAASIAYSTAKIKKDSLCEKKVPIMGVAGALVFAGQMINFTIPATGSSGHIGGGILLAGLIGGPAALLALAAVLIIQCLFFADGGLLALGCNIFNMGVIPCLLIYPLLFKRITAKGLSYKSITIASIVSVVVGLQLGAFGVVLETLASGVTELPFGTFVALMQPIHLAIGIVEGIVTAAILCYVHSARPEILESTSAGRRIEGGVALKKVLTVLIAVTVVTGGLLALFASSHPDGLEWAIGNVYNRDDVEEGLGEFEKAETGSAGMADSIQESTAFLPDYAFASDPDNAAGTTVSGIVGGALTLILAGGAGLIISRAKTGKASETTTPI